MTVHFGGCDDGRVNCLPDPRRLELPRPAVPAAPEIADGTYTFPTVERID